MEKTFFLFPISSRQNQSFWFPSLLTLERFVSSMRIVIGMGSVWCPSIKTKTNDHHCISEIFLVQHKKTMISNKWLKLHGLNYYLFADWSRWSTQSDMESGLDMVKTEDSVISSETRSDNIGDGSNLGVNFLKLSVFNSLIELQINPSVCNISCSFGLLAL